MTRSGTAGLSCYPGSCWKPPWLRTAAAVIIARTAYPSLFSDTDPDEALRMLTEEAAGTPPTGICWYAGP